MSPIDPTKVRQTIETTYADLRADDLVIDKAGQAWPVADLKRSPDPEGEIVDFYLCDPVTKIKMHHVQKTRIDPAKLARIPTHADEVEQRTAEFPVPVSDQIIEDNENPALHKAILEDLNDKLGALHEAILEDLNDKLGASVAVEISAQQEDEARKIAAGEPITLPLFTEMTDLEMRSHLYTLHGVFATDMQSRKQLEETHTEAHRQQATGKLKSKHIEHEHATEGVKP